MVKYFKAEVEFAGIKVNMAVSVESKMRNSLGELAQEKMQGVAEDFFNVGSYSAHALKVSKVAVTTKSKAESGDRVKSYATAWVI